MSEVMRPLAAVMADLAALIKGRASGVQYIVTDDGRFASVRLRAGVVEEIGFKAKFNDEAIRLLAQVGSARSRFEQVFLTPTKSKHAPISADVLRRLLDGSQQSPAPAAPVAKYNTPVSGTPAVPRGVLPMQREAIEKIALTYLGPFASLVCEESLSAAADIERGLLQIATNMADEAEAARFLAEARAAIAKLG
jgi:hypothetical protein